MDSYALIAAAVLMVAALAMLAVRYIQKKKKGDVISINDFIADYGDGIIKCLKSIVSLLSISMSDYATKDEYETALISSTICALKENAAEFGISATLIDLISTESLTICIKKILNDNKLDVFSSLTPNSIDMNKKLLDEDVVTALREAI